MKKVAVVISAFNCQEQLKQLLVNLINIQANIAGYEFKVIVVDDDSTDNTYNVGYEAGCYMIAFGQNQGPGLVARIGLIKALEFQPDFVIHMDGDGQHDPTFIPEMISLLEKGADYVICSRFHIDSKQNNTPQDRLKLNREISNRLSLALKLCITDARSGFFALPSAILKGVVDVMSVERYGYPIELLELIWECVWQEGRPPEVEEIPHPANYHISTPTVDYSKETPEEKQKRFDDAYAVLDMLSNRLGLTI